MHTAVDSNVVSLWEEIDALSQSFYDRVYEAAQELWATKPTGERLTNWLQERVWSEREGAKMHGYVVMKMAEILPPEDVFFLSQQTADEAHHYKLLAISTTQKSMTKGKENAEYTSRVQKTKMMMQFTHTMATKCEVTGHYFSSR